jgi:hypothetical protein
VTLALYPRVADVADRSVEAKRASDTRNAFGKLQYRPLLSELVHYAKLVCGRWMLERELDAAHGVAQVG